MNKQSEKPRGLLSGKTVLLCVTGGIAAYKMPNVARMLKKLGCNVHVLMTQNATNFITATTFETLTANKCLIDTFDRNFEFSGRACISCKKGGYCDDCTGECQRDWQAGIGNCR